MYGARLSRAVQTVQPVFVGNMMNNGTYIQNVSDETVGIPEDF